MEGKENDQRNDEDAVCGGDLRVDVQPRRLPRIHGLRLATVMGSASPHHSRPTKSKLSWVPSRGGMSTEFEPGDVSKDADGSVHVTVRMKHNGEPSRMDFFTSLASCNKYITDEGITPDGAPDSDIN